MVAYHIIKSLAIFLLVLQSTASFKPTMIHNKDALCRRQAMSLIGCGAALLLRNKQARAVTVEDNPPLTPEQMIEYEKLLQDAKRIQHIIDINIKAADNELNEMDKKLKGNSTALHK